jgi:thiamine biosynthesis lipoprotein
MGCEMLAALDTCSPQADFFLAQVPRWFEEWEARLSRFREESELSRLNRSAGRAVQVSPVLWEVLQLALQAAQHSDGLVSPTVLDALVAAGYDRTFEAIESSSPVGRQHTSSPGDWRSIKWDDCVRSICLHPGVRLDLGGVAKGWAADRAARRLAEHGAALVDAGGDVAVSGPRHGGERWPIGVADPCKPERQLDLLALGGGGAATSGRDYRRWKRNGKVQHHIIDPRTGQPAETDVLSATVVGPSACEAEVAAKVALILGSGEGTAWIEERPALAGLLVLEDGSIVRSSRWHSHLWS